MFSITLSRAWFSRSTLVSLVAASVLAGVAPAHATVGVGAVDARSFSFDRAASAGSYTIKAGENATLSSRFIMSGDYTGWPLANKTVITRTPFTSTIPTAMGDQGPASRSIYGTDGSECELWEYAASIKLTPSTTCINFLEITDDRWVTNDTGSNQTITSNAASQVTKFGKSNVTTNSAATSTAVARIYKEDASSVVIAAGEDHLNVELRGCVDESLVTGGETLNIVPVIKRNGTTLTPGTGYYLYGDEYSNTEALTYTVPTEEQFGGTLENIIVNLDNEIVSTTAGTYIGSLDVQNSSHDSVLEACPTYDWTAWPSLSTVDNSGPTLSHSSGSLPTGVDMTNTNLEMYGSYPDGFGGLFYWSYPGKADYSELGGATARLVHANSSGSDNSFNTSGYASLVSGDGGDLTVGRFSPSGAKWFASSQTGKAWAVTTGTMTGTSASTTFTAKNLTKLCPAKYEATWMFPISAPTTNLLAELSCMKGRISVIKVISLTATPTTVATLGLSTTSNPCVVPSMGVDTRASAAGDQAIVFYTRTSTTDIDGYCTSNLASVSARQITSITVSGTQTTNRVTSNPWAGGEPFMISIAPGGTAGQGSWIGITDVRVDMYSDATPGWPFTMTSNLLSENSEPIQFDADDDAALGWREQLTVIKPGTGGKWLVAIDAYVEFDSESNRKFTVATLDPATGELVNGDIRVASGFGNYGNAAMAATLSVSPGQGAVAYTVTGASGSALDVTSWTQ